MDEVKASHHRQDDRQMYGHPNHMAPHPGQVDTHGMHPMHGVRPAHHPNVMNPNIQGLHHPVLDIRTNPEHVNGTQQPVIGQGNLGRIHDWSMSNEPHHMPQTSTSMMPDHRAPYLRDAHPSLYPPNYQPMVPHTMAHSLHLALNPPHTFMPAEENTAPVWPHQIFGENNEEHLSTPEPRPPTTEPLDQQSGDECTIGNVKVETELREGVTSDHEGNTEFYNSDTPEDLCKDSQPEKLQETQKVEDQIIQNNQDDEEEDEDEEVDDEEDEEEEEEEEERSLLILDSTTQSTKEFICPECGKECANKGVLGRHSKYQHGEKKYQCEHCDFKATRKDTFAKHMKLNHLPKERKKGPHLSELDRGRVIALKEVGWTYPSIAQHVGCSATTCKNVWRKFLRDGSHKKAKRRSSHRCTNPLEDAQILQVATMDPNKSAVDIVNELNLNICAKTVRRRLNKLGLFSRMLSVQDHLSVNQMRLRYEFACLYRDDRVYSPEFWKRVVFADEKTFDIDKNGRIKVWHPKCTSFNPADIMKQKNVGRFGVGVNFFACFNADGFAQIHELPLKFGSEDYKNLLRDVIIPSLRMKYPPPQQIYYVQDKSPVHTSSNVAAFFRSMDNITVINLPPKGSDMNPIEDIWNRMTRRVKVNQTWTIEDFRAGIYSSWQWCRQHENYFEQLSGSMTERIMSVIASEGRWAKY